MTGPFRWGLGLGVAALIAAAACAAPPDRSAISSEKNSSVSGMEDRQALRAFTLASTCSGCHQADANGARIVSLKTYDAVALAAALRAYRKDDSGSVMARLARGYTDEEIDLIAWSLTRKEGDR